jgi:hypothetical protein
MNGTHDTPAPSDPQAATYHYGNAAMHWGSPVLREGMKKADTPLARRKLADTPCDLTQIANPPGFTMPGVSATFRAKVGGYPRRPDNAAIRSVRSFDRLTSNAARDRQCGWRGSAGRWREVRGSGVSAVPLSGGEVRLL